MGVDRAHIRIAHSGAVLGLIEIRVFPMENRFLECSFTNWAGQLPIQVVQQLAGHSDISTARKYCLTVRAEDMTFANRVLSSILDKVKAD